MLGEEINAVLSTALEHNKIFKASTCLERVLKLEKASTFLNTPDCIISAMPGAGKKDICKVTLRSNFAHPA